MSIPKVDSDPISNHIPKVSNLPHGFELLDDGITAIKKFTIRDNDRDVHLQFKIIFPDKYSSESSKIKFLQQFNPEKVKDLGTQSRSLGLGKKFQSIDISYNSSGKIKQLDMKRIDGTVKILNMDYFNKKEIEIKKLNDPIKEEKFKKKLKMFKTMNKIMSSNFERFQEEDSEGLLKSFKKNINEIRDKKNALKKDASSTEKYLDQLTEKKNALKKHLKDWYIGDKRVADMFEDYMQANPNISPDELRKYMQENLLNHPDLHKFNPD